MVRRFAPLLAAALVLMPAGAARAVDNPNVPGSDWTQAQIASAPQAPLQTAVSLHADVLRPKNLKPTDKTPVIVSIGPYFNHSGEVGAAGPVEGADYDPADIEHPSTRFDDFINGAKLMEKGYTFVMVDLRGFGGSNGCLDWGGAGEQADVKAAVEWAASQPWSTGSVGMYGKSYDGVTGLIGEVSEPKGLKAVVSMEPVYDLYRYLYSDGVRYENSLATPNLYNAIAATPGPLADAATYNINSLNTPDCLAKNFADQQDADHTSDFWKLRTFIDRAKGKTTPLFLTQGFLENNTKPDGAFDFFNNLAGKDNRAWYGMWDHVRGNETVGGTGADKDRLVEGRAGFFDEVMRFYDRHLKGDTTAKPENDPKFVVQTSDGTWRAETAWPPADSTPFETKLNTGTYAGDGLNAGSQDGLGTLPTYSPGNGIWTFSPPLATDAWYSGVPKVALQLAVDGAEPKVAVDVYDVDKDGKAILVSRNATLVNADGKVAMDLYGNDWKIPAGHRVGVLVTDTNAEWWLPSTPESLDVQSGTISLPFLKHARPATLPGGKAVRLETWEADAPFDVEADTITAGESKTFALPGALTAAPTSASTDSPATTTTTTPTTTTSPSGSSPSPSPATPGPTASKPELRVRIVRRRGHRIRVFGRAPAGAKVKIRLRLHGKTYRTVTLTTKKAHYRIEFTHVRRGRFRAVVVARKGDVVLRGTSRRVRRR